MKITITSLRAVADGAEIELTLMLDGGEEKTQSVKGRIATSFYMESGLPTTWTEPITIDRDKCDYLMYSMQKTSAIKKGIVFLEYAANTKKSLKMKLIRKGYPADIAEEAAEYLAEKGYIREDNDAARYAEILAERKLYGKSRIKKELFAKGFEGDVIACTMEELDVDFAEICAKRLAKSGGIALFSDPETKRKTTAALMRYGFSYDDIRDALDILRESEDAE